MNDFQSLYQSLVETLPVNIFCKDKEGRFNFGNSSYCAGLGKPLAEILGKTDRDFFPPALRGAINLVHPRIDRQVG